MPTGGPGALPCISVGEGPTLLLLHGYGMQPRTYLPTARLLADRARVVIPALFSPHQRWDAARMVDSLLVTLDELGLDRVSLLGHSFGGGLELGLVEKCHERVVECVFSDTLGVRDRFALAEEALHRPLGILRLATRPAVTAFFESWATHPIRLAGAAWWGFASDRVPDIEQCVRYNIPCHVMWAESDTLLSRSDGQEFARLLHATFTVAQAPAGYGPIDHDWMFDDPELFVSHLEQLGLQVLGGAPPSARGRSARSGSRQT